MKKFMLTVLTGTMLLGSPLFADFHDGEGDDEVNLGAALRIFKKPEGTEFSFDCETENFGHYGIDKSRKFSVTYKCGEYDASNLDTYILTRWHELDNVNIAANWNSFQRTWTLEISADALNESNVVTSPQLSVTFQEILQSEPKATEESFPIHRYFIPKEDWPANWTTGQ